MYRNLFKPVFDFMIAFCVIIILSPVIIITTILLAIVNNGKPFFIQPRPGKNERIFSIIKFKTMNDKKDADGNLLPDEKRLTVTGKIVRKTSIDELPQLINVLKGDMSLVGPRPLLIQYLSLYNNVQRSRHHVKPGITGWAQVNGRNAIDWNTKFMYDVYYVKNVSFLLDVKIIIKTIANVFNSENISQQGHATVDYFKGN